MSNLNTRYKHQSIDKPQSMSNTRYKPQSPHQVLDINLSLRQILDINLRVYIKY